MFSAPKKKTHGKAFFCFEFVTSSKAMATNGYDEDSVCQVTQAGQIICCLTPPRSPLKDIYTVNTHYIRCIWGWLLRGFPWCFRGPIFPAKTLSLWGTCWSCEGSLGFRNHTTFTKRSETTKKPRQGPYFRFIGSPYFPLDSLFNRDPYNG